MLWFSKRSLYVAQGRKQRAPSEKQPHYSVEMNLAGQAYCLLHHTEVP